MEAGFWGRHSGDARLLPGSGLHHPRPRTWAGKEAGRHSPRGSPGQLESVGHWSRDTLSQWPDLCLKLLSRREKAFKKKTPTRFIKGLGKMLFQKP